MEGKIDTSLLDALSTIGASVWSMQGAVERALLASASRGDAGKLLPATETRLLNLREDLDGLAERMKQETESEVLRLIHGYLSR